MQNEDIITLYGRKVKVRCDRNCEKAWGINNRPVKDGIEPLEDNELGIAPKDPGTYEGGYGKPTHPDQFPNKWCVRECERCEIFAVNRPL